MDEKARQFQILLELTTNSFVLTLILFYSRTTNPSAAHTKL